MPQESHHKDEACLSAYLASFFVNLSWQLGFPIPNVGLWNVSHKKLHKLLAYYLLSFIWVKCIIKEALRGRAKTWVAISSSSQCDIQ